MGGGGFDGDHAWSGADNLLCGHGFDVVGVDSGGDGGAGERGCDGGAGVLCVAAVGEVRCSRVCAVAEVARSEEEGAIVVGEW